MVDMNAVVGRENAADESMNDNGELLKEFCK